MSGVVLLELMAEGLVGMETLTRIAFDAQLNRWPHDDRHHTAMAVVRSILLNVDELTALQLPNATTPRAALTLQVRNGEVFRILFDIGRNGRALQKQTINGFAAITNDAREVQQALTAQLGIPPSSAWEAVFSMRASTLASSMPALPKADAVAAPKAKSQQRFVPGFDDADAPAPRSDDQDEDDPVPPNLRGLSVRQLQQRLDDIDTAAGAHARLDQLAFEVEGAQRRVEQVERDIRPFLQAQQAQQQYINSGQQFDGLLSLPEDFLIRAERLSVATAEVDREQQRLQTQQEKLMIIASRMSAEVSGIQQRPNLSEDNQGADVQVLNARPVLAAAQLPAVRYGVLVGAVAMVIGLLGVFTVSALRYVALLNIPAFGVALFGALQLIRELEQGASLRLKFLRLQRERKQGNDRMVNARAEVARALQRGGYSMEQLADVVLLTQQRDAAADARAAVEVQLQQLMTPAMQAKVQDHQRQQQEVSELQRELSGQGGLDARSMGADPEGERQAIERQMARLRAKTTAPEPAPARAATPAPVEVTAAIDRYPDITVDVMRALQDVLFTGTDDLPGRLQPRCKQVLGALSSGAWTEVVLTTKQCDLQGRGGMVPFASLPGGDRDSAQFALRVAAIEQASRAGKVVVLIDGITDSYSTAQQAMIEHTLTFVARHAQLVCISDHRPPT